MPEENLYQRGEAWWLLVRVDGHRYRESLRTDDVKKARKLRDARIKEIKARSTGGGHRGWRECVAAWHAHYSSQLAPSTMRRYLVSIKQVEAELGDMDIAEIDGRALRSLTSGRLAAGATPATIRRDLTAVSRVLEFAEANEWREGNPTLNTRRLLKERRDPIELPTEDSYRQLLVGCSGGLRYLVMAARKTGCRQAELVGVKWPQIDFAAQTLEVIGKGNKRRTITLSDDAAYFFGELPRLSDLIFCWPMSSNGPFVNGKVAPVVRWLPFSQAASDFTHARRVVEGRAKEAGREFKRFRFHDLRHLFAVEALRGGMGIYNLSKHLGHTSVKTTEIYLAFLTGEEADLARDT